LLVQPAPRLLPLSLHDALPISQLFVPHPLSSPAASAARSGPRSSAVGGRGRRAARRRRGRGSEARRRGGGVERLDAQGKLRTGTDRKSTRLNSSHVKISYAVFC